MRILLAVDGSSCSDSAVNEVSSRPWPEGSEIKVVTAYEMPLPATPEGWALPATYLDELDLAVKRQAQLIVEHAVDVLKSKTSKSIIVTGIWIPGSPRLVILDEAKEWNADLIVVGSHGYSAWGRFLLGSVSQSIVSHAKCSVEVVRCESAVKPELHVIKEEVREHG